VAIWQGVAIILNLIIPVLFDGNVVGRIFKANAAPAGSPWMETLAFGHHEDRTPTHRYSRGQLLADA
jgi:hypothetical protein